jgi:hypothetical protein
MMPHINFFLKVARRRFNPPDSHRDAGSYGESQRRGLSINRVFYLPPTRRRYAADAGLSIDAPGAPR